MNEEEKEAIEIIKREITKPEKTPLEVYITDIKMLLHLILKLQKENEKQSKIIDEMADKLSEYTCWNKEDLNMYKLAPIEEIKQYFYRKVENE